MFKKNLWNVVMFSHRAKILELARKTIVLLETGKMNEEEHPLFRMNSDGLIPTLKKIYNDWIEDYNEASRRFKDIEKRRKWFCRYS